MKFVFIINPIAGKGQFQKELPKIIQGFCTNEKISWEIYITKSIHDALIFVKNYPKNQTVRFYAVGGDGTLNEVINGAMNHGNCEVGFFPCGSGNDFARIFQNPEYFLYLNRQLNATTHQIDLIKANHSYAINMCNMGLDAQTAADVHRFTKFMPGTMAYSVSLLNSLVHKMGFDATVTLDDEEVIKGTFILATFANGIAYGGGYYSAPKAEYDDGLMDVCLIQPVSRLIIAKLLNAYKNGQHLSDERFKKYMLYRRCKKVVVETTKPQMLCIDGEFITSAQNTMEIIPKAIPLLLPQGATIAKIT
ncbi:MAG: diacylglycerol kinase family lipid kinase [Clostridiales bacterium]